MHIGLLDWLFWPSSKSALKTLCMSISSLPPTHNQFPTHFRWLWDKSLEGKLMTRWMIFRRLISKTLFSWLSDEISYSSTMCTFKQTYNNVDHDMCKHYIFPQFSIDLPTWISFPTVSTHQINVCKGNALVNINQVPVHYIQWITDVHLLGTRSPIALPKASVPIWG